MTDFTPEQHKEYWKKRIADKINSMQGQLQMDKNSTLEMIEHAGILGTKIFQELSNIEIAFANILTELEGKESEDEKPQQSHTHRKPHKRTGA